MVKHSEHTDASKTPEASYRFFANTACQYYPCHEGADPERFNCLFCFCPLYALGPECGGRFRYTETGVKDCTACLFPHIPESYDAVVRKFDLLRDLAARPQQ